MRGKGYPPQSQPTDTGALGYVPDVKYKDASFNVDLRKKGKKGTINF